MQRLERTFSFGPGPSTSQNYPKPSALQSLIATNKPPTNSQHHLHHLALQIAHNLRYQHNWTNIRLHHGPHLTRPMLSGLPPRRLYIHPDEQIELLQKLKAEGVTGLPESMVASEREWVLPSHLRERWTLRRFGEVFEGVGVVPDVDDGEALFERARNDLSDVKGEPSKWRTSQPKRLLLATLDDDSTVVYYIVHDGIVKPRQN